MKSAAFNQGVIAQNFRDKIARYVIFANFFDIDHCLEPSSHYGKSQHILMVFK